MGTIGFNVKPGIYDTAPEADRNFRLDYRATGLKIDARVGSPNECSKRITGIKSQGLYTFRTSNFGSA